MVASVRTDPVLGGSLVEGPASATVVASGAYTATASHEFGVGPEIGAVEAVVICSVYPAAASITLALQGFDPASGTWETLITSAALAATGTKFVQVNPSSAAVTNISAQRVVRPRMRLLLTHADADSLTYSVSIHGATT